MLGPDFFIVGAPKCGTTFLDAHLAAHPEIFMARKEQHFFGSDLADIRPADPPSAVERAWTWRQPTRAEYFASFAGSDQATRRGESSVWYLWSRRAAAEIFEYRSDASIIAMVRNPIEMVPSLHRQALLTGNEDIQDLASALDAEEERRKGHMIPARGPDRRLYYRDVVQYHEQIERYFKVFGRDQVHVILFDDLIADTSGAYRRVLDFLGVDPDFAPDLRPVNEARETRSSWMRRRIDEIGDPSSRMRRVGRRLIPSHSLRLRLLKSGPPALERLNTRAARRAAPDPEVLSRLSEDLAPSIAALEELLDRDLSHWAAVSESHRAEPGAARVEAR
jgi:hypothetical protein